MKTVIISQARMTSTRLPGKVLKEVLGKPLLSYQIERLQRVKSADEIVIATTTNRDDDPIVSLADDLGVAVYRGSENDVLLRYYEAAREHNANAIVRVTSDCPLIDPFVIEKVLAFYVDSRGKYDYVANTLQRTYPRGMDTEVFSMTVLATAHQQATQKPEREHVTAYIYRNHEQFRLGNVAYSSNESRHRWTVDTAEDFELIKRIIEALYPTNNCFTLEDCLQLLHRNPEWSGLNEDIEQKVYGQ